MKKLLKSLSLGLAFAFVAVIMCACVPSNLEKAEARMKDAGYTVIAMGDEAKDEAEGVVGGLFAIKGTDTLTAVIFDSSSSAKDYYEKWVKEDSKVQQSGKWVFVGSDAAVEAFGA